ncbi:MAG TPA: hypothetical protein VH518_20725 [Tepidisphaeraceae bacterium]|jgi:UDP-N-acetylmuramyl pentapeptide phosphotransferase/UDP-N-acetylglucosamine-1-phosphate transferase
MTQYLSAICALLIAAAGWFYLFYSNAASKLAAVEDSGLNRLRIRLRRVGGLMMIPLAVTFYALCVTLEHDQFSLAAGYLLAVLALMGAVLILALVDLRLTLKLRREVRKGPQ